MERVSVEHEGRQYTVSLNRVEHTFGQNQTIDGAIRLHNPTVKPGPKFEILRKAFNVMNDNAVPRVGNGFSIPVLP